MLNKYSKLIILGVIISSVLHQYSFGQKIIKESTSLVRSTRETVFVGNITIERGHYKVVNKNCRDIVCAINVSQKPNDSLGFDIFYPGIKFTFKGSVCLPLKFGNMSLKRSLSHTAKIDMRIRDGKDVSYTSRNITGIIYCLVEADADVIEIRSSRKSPLVFMLTKNGFEYFSGKGIVNAFKGKVYNYN